MPEASQKIFWTPGGPGGRVIGGGGAAGGPVFLKSAFLVFLVMGVWFEILMVCWPCIHFQCWKLRKLIPNMSCIIRFFGDLPRAPLDPGTPMGHPVGVWFKILMVCWPCICFQCWKLRKLIPNMPCIIRFFRDPFWTPRDPRGAWGPPRGVPKYYQDPKVSLVTYSNGSESF